jgi:hypothetical protein
VPEVLAVELLFAMVLVVVEDRPVEVGLDDSMQLS